MGSLPEPMTDSCDIYGCWVSQTQPNLRRGAIALYSSQEKDWLRSFDSEYSAPEKVMDALRLAPFIAGPEIQRFAADIAQLVKDQPILTGIAVGAFAGIQLSPLALPLNVGLILLGGWQAGFSLGSFFYKAATAQNQTQLFDAAREFNNTIANLVGVATTGGLLKLNLAEGFQNVSKLFGAGLEIWQKFKALESIGQTPSFAKGISIVIDKFKNAETAVGRLLQYGDEGVKAFFNASSANAGKLTLEGLTDFANRFKKVFEVAARLDENADVAAFLFNNRNFVKSVLDGGVEAVDDLANLLRRPGITTQDLKDLLGIEDINPSILRQLFDEEGLTVAEIKTGFSVCFVAGTKVLTPSGEQAIESLAVGGLVLASDPGSGAIKPCSILGRFEREAPAVLDIQVGDEIITCTPEHPFWIPGQGWRAARQLEVGDPLLTHDEKTHSIESIQRREGLFKVYNIEVEELHTYYVSSLQILVHNECDLKVVKRSNMPENVATDLNGNSVIIDGKPVMVYGQATQGSSTTPGHGDAMIDLIARLAPTGDYEYFTLQRSWRTATGRVAADGKIPDVIGVRRNGKVDAWEVESTTDDPAILRQRLSKGMNSLPLERRGNIDVIPPKP